MIGIGLEARAGEGWWLFVRLLVTSKVGRDFRRTVVPARTPPEVLSRSDPYARHRFALVEQLTMGGEENRQGRSCSRDALHVPSHV